MINSIYVALHVGCRKDRGIRRDTYVQNTPQSRLVIDMIVLNEFQHDPHRRLVRQKPAFLFSNPDLSINPTSLRPRNVYTLGIYIYL